MNMKYEHNLIASAIVQLKKVRNGKPIFHEDRGRVRVTTDIQIIAITSAGRSSGISNRFTNNISPQGSRHNNQSMVSAYLLLRPLLQIDL